ncbi:TIGR01212 family radical SAM protein [Methanopyrus sp. KOL6]|uniref:TIGR01212 family radical SAM protein n=1 Tax=Methanopyrus sp. KOL6 TaxID=1937004 RepID=UPI001E3CDE88|nr:TIGR01212 family radical SAM protein [Methanopyrus sp. KOL6]
MGDIKSDLRDLGTLQREVEPATDGALPRYVDERIVRELYEDGEKFVAFGAYYRREKGCKVMKAAVDAGFVCPNKDGRISSEGCLFCPKMGRTIITPNVDPGKKLEEQAREQMEVFRERYGAEKFLVYFYPATNTYAPPDVLEELYNRALEMEDVIGLSIGTRPDCLPDDVLDILEGYVKEGYDVWLEIGVQSYHHRTLRRTRRGHGLTEVIDAIIRAKERGIRIVNHIIFGLPGETRDEMLETVRVLSVLGVEAVKLYPLVVLERTDLERMYYDRRYKPLSYREYIRLLADALERMAPTVLIQRLSKDRAPDEERIEPEWDLYRMRVISDVRKELARRESRQGKLYKVGLNAEELVPLVKGATGAGGFGVST